MSEPLAPSRSSHDLLPEVAIPARAALALFLFSGATGLVYQVLWLRQLVLIFGSTLHATSAILSTFMAGLAAGAFIAGRWMSRHRPSPLRVYGSLEIAIGIYALIVPSLLMLLTPAYQAVWDAGAATSFLVFSVVKLVGIALVLLPPTMLMGATLPVLSRAIADDPDRIGGKVGTLYAVNTGGAVLGAFLAGFVALPLLGMSQTLWATAATNVAVGLVAWWLGPSRRASRPSASSTALPSTKRPPSDARVVVALLAFGLSGFGAMLLEVAWTRGLALVLGSSVYAFSLMLIAFLVGLAAGSAVFSAWLRRRPTLSPVTLLVGLFAAAGTTSFATAYLLQALPRLFATAYFSLSLGPNGWFAIQFFLGLLVMFPTTFALGGIFPAVLQLHARGLDRVPGSVGTVYASNTIGTIAGAATAGFILIPSLGVANTIVATAVLELALSLLVVVLLPARTGTQRWQWAAGITSMLFAVLLLRPDWDVLLMNSGVYFNIQEEGKRSSWAEFENRLRTKNVVVFHREGITASVLVADHPSTGSRYLAVNGKVDASSKADIETQILLAHLPLLLHPHPDDVLTIGLASGMTVGSVAAHPVRSIRVAEVESAMVEAARYFSEANGNVLDDPRLTLSINDARNELEFNRAAYDIIISEPSNPWMTVASNLFTEDFFQTAATRVRPGGIFCQWVQTYSMRPDDLRSIIRAFHSAFPHVYVFDTLRGVDLILLGARHPFSLDRERIESRMEELRVRIDLGRMGVGRAEDLLRHFRLGPREVDRLARDAPRNTDDNARVEFSAPKALFLDTIDANLGLLDAFPADPTDYWDPPLTTHKERDALRLDLARAWRDWGHERRGSQLARHAVGGPLDAEVRAFLASLKTQ